MVGLLIVLGIGWLIYSTQIRGVTSGKPLVQQTHLVAVRSHLLSLGQSERLYLAANGSYATLERLKQSDTPTDSSGVDLRTFSIDETMQISP